MKDADTKTSFLWGFIKLVVLTIIIAGIIHFFAGVRDRNIVKRWPRIITNLRQIESSREYYLLKHYVPTGVEAPTNWMELYVSKGVIVPFSELQHDLARFFTNNPSENPSEDPGTEYSIGSTGIPQATLKTPLGKLPKGASVRFKVHRAPPKVLPDGSTWYDVAIETILPGGSVASDPFP